MRTFSNQETSRLKIQEDLDSLKDQKERNRLGQFSTPTELARQIIASSLELLPPKSKINFLDPAIGTGSFFSALVDSINANRLGRAMGYEIDPHYGNPTQELWAGSKLNVKLADFTREVAPVTDDEKFNLLVCNPPYVRHHHISSVGKSFLQASALRAAGVRPQGLAGLYCYFLLLSHPWMSDNGIAAWLIPSEFMDVNYGTLIKRYLLEELSLIRVHRFDPGDVQFQDALVSSVVLLARKKKPALDHQIEFSHGGSLENPRTRTAFFARELMPENKWTSIGIRKSRKEKRELTLGDAFIIKRGIATGNNKFFVLSEEEVQRKRLPIQFLRPLLPGPRLVKANEIKADTDGIPLLDGRLYLLDCRLPDEEVKKHHPELWEYLSSGMDNVAKGYICRHRKPWYVQENRPPAPLLCTYIGRCGVCKESPFRFILNHSRATALNVYLMLYPRPVLQEKIRRQPGLLRRTWKLLNEIDFQDMVGEGRVYGGGMYKLEPKELARVPANGLEAVIPEAISKYTQLSFL